MILPLTIPAIDEMRLYMNRPYFRRSSSSHEVDVLIEKVGALTTSDTPRGIS